jgi:hemerythrin
MAFLSWRKDYLVGVPQIDTEHQYLFRLINDFHDECSSGDGAHSAVFVLNRLVAYAETHFRHEEELMRETAYPGLEQQRAMHEALYSSIFAVKEKVTADPSSIDSATLRFLKTWIVGHIVKEDMNIGDFLRRNGSAANAGATASAT